MCTLPRSRYKRSYSLYYTFLNFDCFAFLALFLSFSCLLASSFSSSPLFHSIPDTYRLVCTTRTLPLYSLRRVYCGAEFRFFIIIIIRVIPILFSSLGGETPLSFVLFCFGVFVFRLLITTPLIFVVCLLVFLFFSPLSLWVLVLLLLLPRLHMVAWFLRCGSGDLRKKIHVPTHLRSLRLSFPGYVFACLFACLTVAFNVAHDLYTGIWVFFLCVCVHDLLPFSLYVCFLFFLHFGFGGFSSLSSNLYLACVCVCICSFSEKRKGRLFLWVVVSLCDYLSV
jgi:hypothetical protein